MKAWPAVTELRLFGVAYCLVGVVELVFARSPHVDGAFLVILAGLGGSAVLAHLVWTLRGLRRAQRAPEAVVVIGTRWRTFWLRVVPGVGPIAALIVFNAALGLGTSWVIGAICLALGAMMSLEAAFAVHVERGCGTQVLRVEQRFVLAH